MHKSLAFTVLCLAISGSYSQHQYGADYGYGSYGVGYGYVSSGYGHGHHGENFGIAKVRVQQAPHNYEYSVQESGPYYHKHVHQSAATHHLIAAPVAVAAPFIGHPGLHGHAGGFAVRHFGGAIGSYGLAGGVIGHGHEGLMAHGGPHGGPHGFGGPGHIGGLGHGFGGHPGVMVHGPHGGLGGFGGHGSLEGLGGHGRFEGLGGHGRLEGLGGHIRLGGLGGGHQGLDGHGGLGGHGGLEGHVGLGRHGVY